MKIEELDYYLPAELIAQHPLAVRSDSRLLVLDRCGRRLIDSRFSSIGDFLVAGDCLVLNDTKVLPARFFARRDTGGKLEGLFLSQVKPGIWEVMLRGARKVKLDEDLCIKTKERLDFCRAQILEEKGDGVYRLKIEADGDAETVLEKIGFPPLPPYIKRDDDLATAACDKQRYQTVYARKAGAVAAPTAGLHFTEEMIEQLKNKGIHFAYVTLHVGAGTFRPITTERLEDHRMYREWFSIDRKNAKMVNEARRKGGRIIAVGTTSVRVLETAASEQQVRACSGMTELFIKPGYKFKLVDAMITNFHLPKSTLLALVAAFAGLEQILAAYNHAIQQQYRFYSYGDAMLIV